MSDGSHIEEWTVSPSEENEEWNRAYLRFESPEQEVRKFKHRLKALGALAWPRDTEIVELFCGRGNGLNSLESLGFTRLAGVDLSKDLLCEYTGSATLYAGDCRDLKFPDSSKDVLIVQGGLHHLPSLPEDLDAVLKEVVRVLRPGGQFVCVEPWLTPFLRFVHWVCTISLARRLYPRLDALAVMIQYERETYERWLAAPQVIGMALSSMFQPVCSTRRFGKLIFIGRTPS